MRDIKKKRRSNWRPFEEARTFARSLGLKSQAEWQVWTKSNDRPDDIPVAPGKIYKAQGWVGFGDWLGTGTIAPQNRIYLSFEEARSFVHSQGLKSNNEWRTWSKSNARPKDIPGNPDQVYQDQGWVSWGDWLGTGKIASYHQTYQPFEEARTFAHSLGLKSQTEWVDWSKSSARPSDIPGKPAQTYKNKGWISWGDWLGTGSIANFNRTFRAFEEARTFAHSLGLKGKDAWGA